MVSIKRLLIGAAMIAAAGSYEFATYGTVSAAYAERPKVEFLALGGSPGQCPNQTCKDDGTNGCKDSSNSGEACQGGETGCKQTNCTSGGD